MKGTRRSGKSARVRRERSREEFTAKNSGEGKLLSHKTNSKREGEAKGLGKKTTPLGRKEDTPCS